MSRTLSIVIPCFNEEKTIVELLSRVEAADLGVWKREIIVVDDGSTDRTRDILKAYQNKDSYRVLSREKNAGKGAAEREGIDAAKGEYILIQDADLEYAPEEIFKLLNVVDTTNAPIVFGSRNLGNTPHRREGLLFADTGVWLSTRFINLLYGTRLTDAWTCYKLFSREVAQHTSFIGDGFEADYLFIGDAAAKGFPIVEVPIKYSPRSVREGKKIRYADGISAMWLLLKHRLTRLGR